MIGWTGLTVLAFLAAAMAVITAVAIRWTAFARTHLRAGLILFLLFMMAGMFVGVLVYFSRGGLSGEVAGLWSAAAIMSASVFVLFVAALRDFRAVEGGESTSSPGPDRGSLVPAVILLVIANEFLMGWSFSLLAGTFPANLPSPTADPLAVVGAAILSPWFVFPMALEMALTVHWLRRELPAVLTPLLLIQPAIMVCSPPTVPVLAWQVATAVVGSAFMAIVLGVLFRSIYRDEPWPRAAAMYAIGLVGSLGGMSGGLYLWVEFGDTTLIAFSLLAQMVVFLAAVANPARFTEPTEARLNASPAGASGAGAGSP